uniref:Hist_deacetyl domain-containing protein n=1 Tax=Heterorhabditis bacteriophora TaxID=37862 RepID=A0A1I7XS36_HETBA
MVIVYYYDSVFMTPDSITAANSAVSCCRTMAEYIMEDKISNGFAIVRPPGHHSDVFSACGFCIFNNTSQAAEAVFNFGVDRILIVDFDMHHGQGTQRIYYEDKRVLYFSIHRYENGLFWPHLQESNFDHIGKGEGRGYTVNVLLNEIGCNDADYISMFWNVLWPLAVEFNPDFVVVSAGFDACLGDPIGEMNLSPDGYSHMIYQLKALGSGKLLMILEIIDKLNETKLLNKCIVIKNGRSASNVELEAVHDRPYIHRIRRTIMMSDEELRNEEISFDPIYLTRESFNIATTAVGAVLQVN